MKCFFPISGILIAMFLASSWYWIANKTTFWGSWNQIKPPLIIFDFDGTICPSYPLFIDQVKLLTVEYNLKKIEARQFKEFRNMTPREIMKTLGVSLFKLPFLLRKARRNVQKQLLELKPVPGIVEVLYDLKSRHYSLGILTSNSLENVLLYLQKYKIDLFDFICTGNNVFGKENHLKIILKKASLDRQKDLAIYIGDEIRDIEAARKAGLTSIAVTWGYNSLSLIRKSSPNFLSQEPSQLLFLIDTAEKSQFGETLFLKEV